MDRSPPRFGVEMQRLCEDADYCDLAEKIGCVEQVCLPETDTGVQQQCRYMEYFDIDDDAQCTPDMLAEACDALSYERCSLASKAMHASEGFVRHQIDSFERFVDVLLPHILHEGQPITVESPGTQRRHVLEWGQHHLQKPTHKQSDGVVRPIFPNECRQRQLTYALALSLDVTHSVYDLSLPGAPLCQTHVCREVLVGTIPVPLRSAYDWLTGVPELADECPLDRGACFIVSGSEKVIVAQQRMRTNRVFVQAEKQPSKFAVRAEVRSCLESKIRSTSTLVIRLTHLAAPEAFVSLPFLQFQIPLVWMFQYLGVHDRVEMAACILDRAPPEGDPELERLVVLVVQGDALGAEMTHHDLLDHLGRMGGAPEVTRERRIKYVEHILRNEFLPHMGAEVGGAAKIAFFAHAVCEMMWRALGRRPFHDKDHLALKRFDTCGTLFALLFRPNWRTATTNARKYLQREADKGKPIEVAEAFKDTKISSSFKYALSTGNWGVKKGGSTHKGVAQVHNRMNAAAALSSLRRLNTHVNKEGKMPRPRQLSHSTWGGLDPVETPDSATQCGLVNNIAMGAHLSCGHDPAFWHDILSSDPGYLPLAEASRAQRRALSAVFVHGVYAGVIQDARALAVRLRRFRRDGRVPFDAAICPYPSERRIDLYADAGCLYRPLVRASAARAFADTVDRWGEDVDSLWRMILRSGSVEYVCKEEEYGYRVAVRAADLLDPAIAASGQPYTHVELDVALLLGACASKIPFMERNQAPRNTYGTGMDKQAESVQSLNVHLRSDQIAYSTYYGQTPLVQTRTEAVLQDGLCSGQNVMLVSLCFTGYNVEDAVIVNEHSVQRGLFRGEIVHTYREEERQRDGARIEPPPDGCRGMRKANYGKLGPAGFAPPGTGIRGEDVLIGKTTHAEDIADPSTAQPATKRARKRDGSFVLKTNEPAVVDRVFETTNRDGARTVKVVTRAMRLPDFGDKICSRHGQKGVIGMLYGAEDMPFVMSGRNAGMVPDIIVNPHGMVSRMTGGMYSEGIAAKVAAATGRIVDGSAFSGPSNEDIGEMLRELGYAPHGKEMFANPFTGEPMEGMVFFAPMFYQRLKHVAIDKIHARSTGPVQAISRQPVEGRIKSGGLRFGEMERDSVVGHGASALLKDRLIEHSDPNESDICGRCGIVGISSRPPIGDDPGAPAYCRGCRTSEHMHRIKSPYCAGVLAHETMAVGMALRYHTVAPTEA